MLSTLAKRNRNTISLYNLSKCACTSSTNVNKAVIIGGGPCGSIAALALQRKGIKCHVHERSSDSMSPKKSNIVALHGGALCLKYLGYESEWLSIVNEMNTVEYRSSDGNIYGYLINDISSNTSNLTTPGFVSQQSLYELGARCCLNNPDIEYSFNSKFLYYSENNNDNTITAHFEDGTTSTGNILIGADGINSNVRKYMLGNDNDQKCKIYSGFSFFYVNGKISDIDPDNITNYGKNTVFELSCENNECMVFYRPQFDEDKYTFALFYKTPSISNTDWGTDVSVNQIIDKLSEYKWSVNWNELVTKSEIRNNVSIYVIKLNDICDSWHSNRAVLIGDAAHAMTPFGGHGANQAIYDGIELAHLFEKHAFKSGNYNKMLNKFSNNEIETIFRELYDFRSPIVANKVGESLTISDMMMTNNYLKKEYWKNRMEGTKQMIKPDVSFELNVQQEL